jgi:hypothetical protein
MRFLDANVFVYAFYKPKGKLKDKQLKMKEAAKEIVKKISNGEEKVMTTVVHLSEVSNILKRSMSLENLQDFLMSLYSLDNMEIHDVRAQDYLAAVDLINELELDPNDCLAVRVMREAGVEEIYTFDMGLRE